MPATSLQYKLSTTKSGYRQLDQALLDMGRLQNALIQHRRSATGWHKGQFSLNLQNKAITDLRRTDPVYNTYSRRLLAATAKRVNLAYAKAFREPRTGFPRTASPYRFATLEVSEPAVSHLKVSDDGKTGLVHIKGLPLKKFNTDRQLPRGTQPGVIRMTRTPRRWLITEPKEWPEPELESVGIDPGVMQVVTAVDDTGQVLQLPGLEDSEHRKVMRRLMRKAQRQGNAALKDGRARFVSQKLRSGSTISRFRWEGQASRNYLRTINRLRRVEQIRHDGRRGFQHRLTTQLARQYRTICMEDTGIRNMTRSARGTVENPGSQVRQKAGLNRSILSQGWYGIRLKLEYKCQWHGQNLIAVPARNTSRSCSKCGYANPGNRPSQAAFQCLECVFATNADVNAAENIRRQGLKLLAKAERGPAGPPGRAAGAPKGQQAQKADGEAIASLTWPALHA